MTTTTDAPYTSTVGDDVRVTQWRVVRAEVTKFLSLRSSYWTMLTTLVLLVGLGAAIAAMMAAVGPEAMGGDPGGAPPPGIDGVSISLNGVTFAQLAVGVLGVLAVTGEYSTGMIRSTLTAVPRRLPMLWGKAAVVPAITLLVTLPAVWVAFAIGQLILDGHPLQVAVTDPGVARAVTGAALYLAAVALLGVALGAVIRNTAGAITVLVTVLLVMSPLTAALPSDWQERIAPYTPAIAGQAVMQASEMPNTLDPWVGFAVFIGYVVVLLALAAVLLSRRDA